MKGLEVVLSHGGRKENNLPPTGMRLSLTFGGLIQGPEEYTPLHCPSERTTCSSGPGLYLSGTRGQQENTS